MEKKILTVQQAAEKKGIGVVTVRRGIKHPDPAKRLPAYKGRNGRHEIYEDDFDQWWATARLVEVKQSKRRTPEPMEGAENAKKTQRNFIGAQWLQTKKEGLGNV